MENETNEEEALIAYESLKSDVGPLKAKKRWDILRRAILSNYDTSENSEVDTLPALKKRARKTREQKRRIQAKLTTIIETAREELETAELKAEKVTTTYKEVVTDLRRKITIAEHRKIIENAFAGGKSIEERKMSVNDVAQGMRIVRKMEATHDRIRARKNYLKKMANKRSGSSPIVGGKREQTNSSVESKREDDISSAEGKEKGGNVPSSESNNEESVSSAHGSRKKNVPEVRKKNRQGTKKREKATKVNRDGEKEAPCMEGKMTESVSNVDRKLGRNANSNQGKNVSAIDSKDEETASSEEESVEKDYPIVESKHETTSEGDTMSRRRKGVHKNGIKITMEKKKDGPKGKEGKKSKKKVKKEKESVDDHMKDYFDDDTAGEMKNDFGEVMPSMDLKSNAPKQEEDTNRIFNIGSMDDFEEGGQIIAISREIQKRHKHRLKDEIKSKMKLPSVSESLNDDEDRKINSNKDENNDSFENDLDVFHEIEEADFELKDD